MVLSLIVMFILEATSMDVQLQTKALVKHTTVLLVKGASKLTLGQSLTGMTSTSGSECLRDQRPPIDDGRPTY